MSITELAPAKLNLTLVPRDHLRHAERRSI